MTSLAYERLTSNLKALKMNKIGLVLDNYIERATKDKIPIVEILDYLIYTEKVAQDEQSLIMRTNVAGFPFRKTIEEYDFTYQPGIDIETINELKTTRFIHNKENVILLGPPGVGKTHLAIALGLEAVRHKFSTYYINCYKLITQLIKATQENQLEAKLKKLSAYRVLVIDEIGYLTLDKLGANLFFQLISRRYEKNSVIITSNRNFAEWGEVFGDNIVASAILDRLLHHSTVVTINGNSYKGYSFIIM